MNICIVGATGNVGRKILDVLEKKNFSIDELYLVASERSVGKKISFKKKEYTILNLEEFDFSKCDITFFSAGGEIAKKFAEIETSETPSERVERFNKILNFKKSDIETKTLKAELNILLENFPEARRSISDLTDKDQANSKIYTLMAAIEKGSGSSDSEVKGWLAKAVTAKRSKRWVCSNCKSQGSWAPICKKCNSFSTMEWISLLSILSAQDAFRKVSKGEVDREEVINFLLQDDSFPRSITRCLSVIRLCLDSLPKNENIILKIRTLRLRFDTASLEKFDDNKLHIFLDKCQRDLITIDKLVEKTYF